MPCNSSTVCLLAQETLEGPIICFKSLAFPEWEGLRGMPTSTKASLQPVEEKKKKKKVKIQGTSLGVQWLRLCLPIQGVKGSVPGQKAKISHASQPKDQNIKQSSIVNKYNKDLKMVHIKKRKKKQNFTLLSTTTCNRS